MDASTIASIIRTGFTILSSIFVVVIFCVVKFNDLVHIDKKLDKLDVKYDEQGKEIGKLSSQISSIDGYIKAKQENN